MNKRGFLYSLFLHKCPRCRHDDLFAYPIYKLGKLLKMKERCMSCGQTYHPEPGFYYGAMYVSYAVQVALFAAVFAGWKILESFEVVRGPEATDILLAVLIVLLPSMPWVFRFSRSLWIHFFIRHNPEAMERYEQKVKDTE